MQISKYLNTEFNSPNTMTEVEIIELKVPCYSKFLLTSSLIAPCSLSLVSFWSKHNTVSVGKIVVPANETRHPDNARKDRRTVRPEFAQVIISERKKPRERMNAR